MKETQVWARLRARSQGPNPGWAQCAPVYHFLSGPQFPQSEPIKEDGYSKGEQEKIILSHSI